MSRLFRLRLSAALWGAAALCPAQPVPVPNGSFESPATFFVSTRLDHWEDQPRPDDYVEAGGFLWEQLTGVFRNTPAGSPDHLENLHGQQAAWLFAVPGVGLWQELGREFEPGTAYQLDALVLGNGGNMLPGPALEFVLGAFATGGEVAPLASLSITNDPALFPLRTRLTPFQLRTPLVREGDAWAGRPIVIQILSRVTPAQQGGYWDVDDVRLTAVRPPAIVLRTEPADDALRIVWPAAPGFRYQLQRSASLETWTNVGGGLNGRTGELSAEVPVGAAPAFFRVAAQPQL